MHRSSSGSRLVKRCAKCRLLRNGIGGFGAAAPFDLVEVGPRLLVLAAQIGHGGAQEQQLFERLGEPVARRRGRGPAEAAFDPAAGQLAAPRLPGDSPADGRRGRRRPVVGAVEGDEGPFRGLERGVEVAQQALGFGQRALQLAALAPAASPASSPSASSALRATLAASSPCEPRSARRASSSPHVSVAWASSPSAHVENRRQPPCPRAGETAQEMLGRPPVAGAALAAGEPVVEHSRCQQAGEAEEAARSSTSTPACSRASTIFSASARAHRADHGAVDRQPVRTAARPIVEIERGRAAGQLEQRRCGAGSRSRWRSTAS